MFVARPPNRRPKRPGRVSVYAGDLGAAIPLNVIAQADALINCAGNVAGGDTFVALIDRLVTAVDSLPIPEQPICWSSPARPSSISINRGAAGLDRLRISIDSLPVEVPADARALADALVLRLRGADSAADRVLYRCGGPHARESGSWQQDVAAARGPGAARGHARTENARARRDDYAQAARKSSLENMRRN